MASAHVVPWMNEETNAFGWEGSGGRAPAGNGRRRGVQSPPVGNTGALTTDIITGVLSVR